MALNADVVVVDGGNAALCAALAAREQGASGCAPPTKAEPQPMKKST